MGHSVSKIQQYTNKKFSFDKNYSNRRTEHINENKIFPERMGNPWDYKNCNFLIIANLILSNKTI